MGRHLRNLGLVAALLSPIAVAPNDSQAQEMCVTSESPLVCSTELEQKLYEKTREELRKTDMVDGLWRNITNFQGSYDTLVFMKKDEGELTIRYWVERDFKDKVDEEVVDFVTYHFQKSFEILGESMVINFDAIDIVINPKGRHTISSNASESNLVKISYNRWRKLSLQRYLVDTIHPVLSSSHELAHIEKNIHIEGYRNKDKARNKEFREVIAVMAEAQTIRNALGRKAFGFYLHRSIDNSLYRQIGVHIFNDVKRTYGTDTARVLIEDLTKNLVNNENDFDAILDRNGVREGYSGYIESLNTFIGKRRKCG